MTTFTKGDRVVLKFAVGQRVVPKSNKYTVHKGKELVVISNYVSDPDRFTTEGYGVGLVGNADIPHSGEKGWVYYNESDLEAWVNPAGRAAEAAGYKVGDRVEVLKNVISVPVGSVGTVQADSAGVYIRVRMDYTKHNYNEPFNAHELKPFVEKPKSAFEVGQFVEYNHPTNDRWQGGKGEVVEVGVTNGYYKEPSVRVKMLELPPKNTLPSNVGRTNEDLETCLRPWVAPKTSGAYAEKSGFKFGDRVQVNRGNSFMTASAGKLGNVIEGGGSSLIRVRLDGETDYLAFYRSEISHYTEPKFKVGDYVEVTKANSTFSGTKGWVVEPSGYWAGRDDTHIHINTKDKVGKAQWRFAPSQLIAAEEPFVPKFKKGDWVEVTKEHNPVWAGIGQIESEATKGWSDVIVKLATGDRAGRTGGFAEAKLIAASEPVPFKVGDYVEVVENPKSTLYYHAGKQGWVVEPKYKDGWIHVSLEGKDKKATYRYDPKDLKAAEEPKPFAIGERVQVDGYGSSGAYDHIIGVVIGFEDDDWDDDILWVQIDATESEHGKFRRFPAENLKKLPKRELPTGAGKIIHITKYDGDTVDLHAMCDGTADTDPWFAPTPGDGDYWLDTALIEQWSDVKVTTVS